MGLKWTYELKNQAPAKAPEDWAELLETRYAGLQVKVSVRLLSGHTMMPRDSDHLSLRVYSDETNYVGLSANVGKPETTHFFKPREGGGTLPMDESERPNLEEFVAQHKQIFASHRGLRDTYKDLLGES